MLPGQVFHVTARGVRLAPLFADDIDRRRYVDILAGTVFRCRWICLAYCLMGNHVHLLVRLRSATLSRGMQRLLE